MGKVLKFVAAIALVAVGVATGNPSLILAGASIGVSALAKRPKAPRVSPESIDRLNASIDPRTPRKGWWGKTAGNSDIRDQEYTDSQTFLHRFIVCAAHRTHGYRQIWFDDKLAWTSAGGVQGEYVGYLTVTPITEGTAGNAINISARMGSTRRFTGCSYVYLRYKVTGNSKKTESPFAQGIPSRITIVGDGALVYDPRLDSTVPGGSGSHRADDQATWEWDEDASRNPALLLLWYLLGWRINGVVSIGCGIPPSRIDFESFITAANLCDEPVSLAAGGTEPRYRADGVFSDGDEPENVIGSLKAAMNADLDDVGGRFRLTVFHNDLADPGPLFTDDDMIAGFRWLQTPPLSESFNIVRGSFVDARDAALYQMVDTPQIEFDSPDGIDRFDNFPLDKVQSASQWQRLAKQRAQRQLYGGEFTTTFGVRGWKLRKNLVIPLTFSRLGWTEKLFRVAEMDHEVDGSCPVTLREENAAIYAWDEDEAPAVEPADPTVYDFSLSPIVQDMPTNAQLSRLDPDTGRGADNFQSSTGFAYSEFVDTGEAFDGDAVNFATTLDRVPKIIFTVGGNAPTAGSNVIISAEGLTVSGFTMRAVEQVVVPGSTITDTGASAGGGGEPDYVINRTDGTAPFDGRFTFSYDVNVGTLGPGEPGTIEVGIFVKVSGLWVQAASARHNSSGTYARTITPGTVDFGAGAEFGVSVLRAEGAGTDLTGFNSVVYNLGSVTESSLTPAGASPIQWFAVLT